MREARVSEASLLCRRQGLEGRRSGSRGSARLKAVIWLLIFGGCVYVGFKAVPVYFANYELQDKMETEARFAVVNRRSADEVRDIVFREAQARDIPVARENIKVESNERGVRISVNYTVTLDLRVYQWQLSFNPRADSRTL